MLLLISQQHVTGNGKMCIETVILNQHFNTGYNQYRIKYSASSFEGSFSPILKIGHRTPQAWFIILFFNSEMCITICEEAFLN